MCDGRGGPGGLEYRNGCNEMKRGENVAVRARKDDAREIAVGDTVFAHWAPANAYFVGTVVEASEDSSGFLIVFEDGDVDVVSKTRVLKGGVGVGSQVFARWRDGTYYRGRVDKVVGRALHISYDDGDKGWVPWSAIGVKRREVARRGS